MGDPDRMTGESLTAIMSKTHYRSVFVSDIHLGAAGARTDAVIAFLDDVDCEYLYLVGDVIDGWVGRKDRKWTPPHAEVIRVILEFAKTGCVVRYTPGNHDAFMRRLHGTQIGAIEIEHSFSHRTADGKDLLVVHGDLFDKTCTKYQPVAFIGAWMYEAVWVMNKKVNEGRAERGKRNVDFATALKRGVKKFIGKATNYESGICEFGREGGFDGVVCGHVHKPLIESFEDGFVYVNSGDWVEHCTAVVEHFDGRLELLDFMDEPEKEARLPAAWKTIRDLVTQQSKGE